MKPTKKSPLIDDLLTSMMGKSRTKTVEAESCMTCTTPELKFRDESSRREYRISGMCQKCQDGFFE
jgi:hypothetical protein